MKKLIVFALAVLLSSSAIYAQCGGRYQDEVFPAVTKVNDVVYATNTTIGGASVDLKMDIYFPDGDTLAERPVILIAHGGSFVAGNEEVSDVVNFCNTMAKRGYVTASMTYRLYDVVAIPDSLDMMEEVIMATGDMKSAIRFLRINASTYGIDTNQVYLAGSSAGAIVALHTAYMTDMSEVPDFMKPLVDNNGGLKGNSGNYGPSSKVRAVINLAGAIKDYNMVNSYDPPLMSIHGTADDVVPFGRDVINFTISTFTIPITRVDGSGSIHTYMESNGYVNTLYAIDGAGHVPHGSAPYDDSLGVWSARFLYQFVDCNPDRINVGMELIEAENTRLTAYPNPAADQLTIELNISDGTPYIYSLISTTGEVVYATDAWQYENSFELQRNNLPAGTYILDVMFGDYETRGTQAKVVFY